MSQTFDELTEALRNLLKCDSRHERRVAENLLAKLDA